MPPDPSIDTVDRWLKYTSNYGMSVVFTACVLLFLLWVSWTVVSLLRRWVPIWFAWTIRSHQKTCEYLDRSTETLSCIHDNTHALGEAATHIVLAAHKLVDKNSDIRGSSDVIIHLEDGLDALKQADRLRRRREEERRRREEFDQMQEAKLQKELNGESPPGPTDSQFPDEYSTPASRSPHPGVGPTTTTTSNRERPDAEGR